MIKKYLQQFKIDFNQRFAAIVKPMTVCILFVITIFFNPNINQMDIKTIFFYKKINKLLFLEILKSYYNNTKNMVCKLNKVFYRLNQSPQI